MKDKQLLKHFSWVPTLYFAEGLPYIIVMSLSTIMYKDLGLSNSEVTAYTSLLYFPWVIKFLWGPLVDFFLTKRTWILATQLVGGLSLAGVAFGLLSVQFVAFSLIGFWVMAFASATHDIAADGYYMIVLNSKAQSFYVGMRSLFYRLAMVFGTGILVIWAAKLGEAYDNITGWSMVFGAASILFLLLSFYHRLVLPKEPSKGDESISFKSYFKVFIDFFYKKNIVLILLFILFYRFGEAMLSKISALFLMDDMANGGLALTKEQVGWVYGTWGVVALSVGGILGGIVASRHGLKFWLWPMAIAMKLPDLVYVYLSHVQPENINIVSALVVIEQFGYGFGFTAFMLYLIYVCDGIHKTSHYALATGLMAFAMMVPGFFSGLIQEHLGYSHYFYLVIACTIPGLLILPFLKIDPDFAKK